MSMAGRCMALRTSSGMVVGPGMLRNSRPLRTAMLFRDFTSCMGFSASAMGWLRCGVRSISLLCRAILSELRLFQKLALALLLETWTPIAMGLGQSGVGNTDADGLHAGVSLGCIGRAARAARQDKQGLAV